MYTKIIAFIIQFYFYSRAVSPPNPNSNTKKIMSTEGIVGVFIAKFSPLIGIFINLAQSLLYIHIMYQQEIGSIPIIKDKFSQWNLFDIVWFLSVVGGSILRVWCFNCLKEFFTFHVTIKDEHKLITTGPYSLLIHPSYTGCFVMQTNFWIAYQICYYIPVYFDCSLNWNQILFWWTILSVFGNIMMYKRVIYEEAALKKRFGKEWEVYVSQRKRFIPYII